MVLEEEKPVIGVVHLPPLPGAPKYDGKFSRVLERAIRDSKAYVEGGLKYILIENFGDAPFQVRVKEPETIIAMTVVTREVIREVGDQAIIGINLLRNSGPEAMVIAILTGAKFIRVNALCQVIDAPEGILKPVAREIAETVFKLKSKLGEVKVLADVNVKHGKPLTNRDIIEVIRDTIERGGAHAIIVTGKATSEPPSIELVEKAKMSGAKIFIGSGISIENLEKYWKLADGFIIGSYFKIGGETSNPVDVSRVEKFMKLYRRLSKSGA